MDYPTTLLGWAGFVGLGGLGFLFVITLVVFVHELGHFLAARYFGVKVESFSIGFGRGIVGFTDRYGTRWKIGWLPLGGYVKFWGDEGVSSTPDHAKLDHASAAELRGSFHHKKLYQKAIIAVAGPVANFILAIVILTALYGIYGDVVTSSQIGRVKPDMPAAQAGFQVGDTILSINGQAVNEFQDVVEVVSVAQDTTLHFVVRRKGEQVAITVTPRPIEKRDFLGRAVKDSGIGIGPVIPGEVASVAPNSPAALAKLSAGDIIALVAGKPLESSADIADRMAAASGKPVKVTFYREGWNEKKKTKELQKQEVALTPAPSDSANVDERILQSTGLAVVVPGAPKAEILVRFGPLESVARAFRDIRFIVVKSLYFIGQLLTGTGDYQQLSGPLGIASVSGQVLVFFGIVALINLAAVLSVSIGLLNLFPIPMLDGGHLLYYGIEAVRGRPLGERAQEIGYQIGFALVVSLMLFATWNDLTSFKLF